MAKGFRNAIGPLIGVLVFCAAVYVLQRELGRLRYADVVRQLRQLPPARVALALLITALNYWVLTGYDALALRYIRRPMPYRRIALASFTSYSFSNNVGLAVLGASAVRYRLYTLWGLSVLEVGAVVAFCMMTTWLGVLAVAGGAFLVHAPAVPAALHLPFSTFRPVGVIFLALVAAYLLAGLVRSRSIRVRSLEFRVPPARMRAAQVVLSVADWVLVAMVLYMLLPASANVPLPAFIAIFLAAQASGFASAVPGGLGVFETVLLLLLRPYVAAPEVVGSLLAFRAVYYLLPLCVGALALGVHEAHLRRHAGLRLAASVARWGAEAVPPFFAAVTFLAGVVLLFSGALPAAPTRLAWLGRLLPLPVMEAGHFLGSLVGAALLLVARGLQRRVDAAYVAGVVLLSAGVLFSLVRGLGVEQAAVLLLLLAALAPCRREFYRRASLFGERFSPGWSAAVAAALFCTAWLGVFAHRHVQYSHDLWWRFSLQEGEASRFLRGTVGAVALTLLFALAKLLRPAPPKPVPPDAEQTAAVLRIVEASPRSDAHLALLAGRSYLLNAERTAFVAYATHGRNWIALGDPVGPDAARAALAWQFQETADRSGGRTVFHNVRPEGLSLYVDLGLELLQIGEEARVDLQAFSPEGRAAEPDSSFQVVPAEAASALLKEMEPAAGPSPLPVALLSLEGRPVAYATIWEGAGMEEASTGPVRCLPDAPADAMDRLLTQTMAWARGRGCRWFGLGDAPPPTGEAGPVQDSLSTRIYRHGSHFDTPTALRAYLEKSAPVWEPRYLALPGIRALPRVLEDLAAILQ